MGIDDILNLIDKNSKLKFILKDDKLIEHLNYVLENINFDLTYRITNVKTNYDVNKFCWDIFHSIYENISYKCNDSDKVKYKNIYESYMKLYNNNKLKTFIIFDKIPVNDTSINNEFIKSIVNPSEEIDFGFEWQGKNLDKVDSKVLKFAQDLLDMNLVYVEKNLNSINCIEIHNPGICNSKGMIKSYYNNINLKKPYSFYLMVKQDGPLNIVCKDSPEINKCFLPTCPIIIAGYLWYLKHKNHNLINETSKKVVEDNVQILENNNKNNIQTHDITKNDSNYTTDKISEQIKEITLPLTSPNVFCFRASVIADEGISKDKVLLTIANTLYNFNKIHNKEYIRCSIQDIPSSFNERMLYVIDDLKDCLNYIGEDDNFSEKYKEEYNKIIDNIKKLTQNVNKNYIIICGTEFEIKNLFNINSKLSFIFKNKIIIDELTIDEIYEDFYKKIPDTHKKYLPTNYKEQFYNYVKNEAKRLPFKNYDLSTFLATCIKGTNEFEFPVMPHSFNTIEDSFKNIVGMSNIKQELRKIYNYLLFKKNNKYIDDDLKFNMHMLFLGNPGTGKTMMARIISNLLFELGYIKENKCIEITGQGLISPYIGQTGLKTMKVIKKALNGVLFIDEAYTLAKDHASYAPEALAVLIKAMEDYKDNLVIIFAGYSKEMQEFVLANSGIQSRIGYTFEFADYSTDELYEMLLIKLNKMNMKIDDNAKSLLLDIIKHESSYKNFGNGRYIDTLLQKILIKHASLSDKEDLLLTDRSIPTIDELMSTSVNSKNESIESFDDIVGLKEIKDQILNIKKYISFSNKASKKIGKHLPFSNYNMLFLGNSGTGKTTVAKKMTQILYDAG